MKFREFEKRVKEMNELVSAQVEQRKRLPPKEQVKQMLENIESFLALHLQDRLERSRKIRAVLAKAKQRGVKLGGTRGARRRAKVSLKVLREKAALGWTQIKIARHFGVSQGWVSQKLNGGR